LYGTSVALKPAFADSITPARWPTVPVPASAWFRPLLRLFAAFTTSATDCHGASARTTSTIGTCATSATGTRSFAGSKGMRVIAAGLIARLEVWPMPIV
jgi:hypothetical protein